MTIRYDAISEFNVDSKAVVSSVSSSVLMFFDSKCMYECVYVHVQRDVQLRFDGVRGSVPEFTNFAVDPQSTLPNTDTLVCIWICWRRFI